MNANPGDLVVCVKEGQIQTRYWRWNGLGLRKGAIRRVTAIGTDPVDGTPVYWVSNFPEETPQVRWRKLNDGDEIPGMIERIKRCKPAKQGEAA